MNLKEILFNLSSAVAAGTLTEASDKAYDMLLEFADCTRGSGLSVIGKIKGESDYTLMLDAHIDEVSFIVTDVDECGFVTLSKCGGIDLRSLPARPIIIHGKRKVDAVFCSIPPHLSSGEKEYDDICELKVDSLLGADATSVISVGDYATYSAKPVSLIGNRVTGKSFDDRAGVACLIELARRLSGKVLPFNVCFLLSDAEELGARGAKTAAFAENPDEAIAIDVSFGDGPDIKEDECGRLGGGAMIGVSPVLDKKISRKLMKTAEDNKIPYQTEVMGSKTGTNGDVIAVSRGGVKTGLVSIPLRNMHTDTEIVDISDIESVCDILEKYILDGGILND